MMIVFNDTIEYGDLKKDDILKLKKKGIEYIGASCRNSDDIIKYAKDADILVDQSLIEISSKVLKNLPKLKAIIRRGIGYDNIDVIAAKEKGIYVCNTPDYCVEEVSTHAVSLLLAYIRKIPKYHIEIIAGNWDDRDPFFGYYGMDSLLEEAIGIIGFGKIGSRVFEKLEAFKAIFLVYDPYIKVTENKNLKQVSLEKLLKKSKYIILCCSLTDKTFHILDRKQFEIMRSDAAVINISRGKLINEPVLIEYLESKKIDGAALDVFEEEPIDKKSRLLELDNIILSPHSAWLSDKSKEKSLRMVINEIMRLSDGKPPKYAVNI